MQKNSFTCAYCRHRIVLQDADVQQDDVVLWFDPDRTKHGPTGLRFLAAACPNHECRELTLVVSWHDTVRVPTGERHINRSTAPLNTWQLRPESSAKPQPAYVPAAVVEDYSEACRIRDLSPKASATLARRCLQGMIRDFWGVTNQPNLYGEIEAIKDKVDSVTWDAIDAVRGVGNIGAHMEKDISLIVPVEPEEAQLLIGLIETLIEEWYIARYTREQRMGEIRRMGEEKTAAKRGTTKAGSNNP